MASNYRNQISRGKFNCNLGWRLGHDFNLQRKKRFEEDDEKGDWRYSDKIS